MTDLDSDRRKLLKAGGATMLIGLAGCIGPFEDTEGVPGTVNPSEDDGEEDGNGNGDGGDQWLSDVPNHDGSAEDLTGQESVEIRNGEVQDTEGTYVFEPPEIRIDPGTAVQWTWVGDVGHSVTHRAEDGEEQLFNSEVQSGDGNTFEYTFDETGVFDYYCIPHRSLGQKGRIQVGDVAQVQSWMSEVPNWGGSLEDMTGQDEVTVQNGEVEDAEGTYIFEPPGITVDVGAKVTWEWVGDVGHSVTNEAGEGEDPLFNSEVQSGDGNTFEFTFDEAGVYQYYCIPHRSLGQKGVVVARE